MSTLYGETIQLAASQNQRQIEFFIVTNPPQSQFTLANKPMSDDDNDPLIIVKLNGVSVTKGTDYTLNNAIITWSSSIALEAGGQRNHTSQN